MDISKRIIQLREARNMSTNKLANDAGISQSYLREIELGKKNPTVEMLSYLCDALHVSLQTFFSEDCFNIHPLLLSAISKLNESEQMKLADLINEMKKQP